MRKSRVDPDRKTCPVCGKEKSRKEFYVRKKGSSAGCSTAVCKPCDKLTVLRFRLKRLYKREGFEAVMRVAEGHIARGQEVLKFLHEMEGER